MAQRKKIPFLGGSNKDKTISVNNQLTVNLMTAVKGEGAKAPVVLESAPGPILRGAAGNGACRTAKLINWKGLQYGVYGTKLVSVTAAYVATDIGTINTSGGQVVGARGRNYIMHVDGTNGYTYDGTTFAQITDLDFPNGATHCVYIDGFFIAHDPTTDNFFISALENPTSWNALDFDAASVAPDNALALAATKTILWIFGDETAQPYFNNENPDFPYSSYLTGAQEVGVLSIYSVAESDDGIFYLATTPEGGRFVWRLQGIDGSKVSNEEQESRFDELTNPENAVGFIYKQSGKTFYVLQFLDDDLTMVYNVRAKVWEDRQAADGGRWRAAGHGIINKVNIIGDIDAGNFYELSLTNYSDGDNHLIRKRRTQIIHQDNRRIDYSELVVDFEPAVGLSTGQGSDPQCKLRYSDDGGFKFSNVLTAPIGKIGKSERRCRFSKLGAGRNRIWEIYVSDPVPVVIKGAYATGVVLND